jgi:hypothetical protein
MSVPGSLDSLVDSKVQTGLRATSPCRLPGSPSSILVTDPLLCSLHIDLMLLIYLYLFVAFLSLLAPIPAFVASSRLCCILHSSWSPRSFPAVFGIVDSPLLYLVPDPRSCSEALGCCCTEGAVCSRGSPAPRLGSASALVLGFLSPVLLNPRSRWHPGFGRPGSSTFRGVWSALFPGLRPRSSHVPHFPPPLDSLPALPRSLRGSAPPRPTTVS